MCLDSSKISRILPKKSAFFGESDTHAAKFLESLSNITISNIHITWGYYPKKQNVYKTSLYKLI